MRKVVITGIGMVSPIGNDKEIVTKNLKNGKNGIDYIKRIDTSNIKVNIAGECQDFEPLDHFSKKEVRRLDRVNMFGIVAARDAVIDSGIDLTDYDPRKVSVLCASGIGGFETIEKESFKAFEKGFNRISPFFIPMIIPNMTSAQIAIDLGIHGEVSAPVTACAASNNAIMDAYRNIKDGYSDVVLAGGAEASITAIGLSGFASMKALCESNDPERASIPFDRDRSGFVMGEGSTILVMEEYESAIKRGAHIYGEVIGAAMTCDANHITAPAEGGVWAASAMKSAIEDAEIEPSDIDYINAHGTSTPLNDKVETEAIKNCFGDYAYKLSISSTKSMTGHLLGASGALEMAITLFAMENSFVPPTINYLNKDEDCDLDITPNNAVEKNIDIAMSNSLGFGGHNCSIVVRRVN